MPNVTYAATNRTPSGLRSAVEAVEASAPRLYFSDALSRAMLRELRRRGAANRLPAAALAPATAGERVARALAR